jgi:hypothetical protein
MKYIGHLFLLIGIVLLTLAFGVVLASLFGNE